MKKIILALFAFLLYSMPAFASMCNPADNIYDYLVPGCIRQDESYIATGTGTDVCVTAAKICSGTQIPNANLAAITGTSMVSGAALYNLSSTPSGAGAMPIVNGGTGQTSRQSSMDALFAASMSGTTGQTLVSNGTDAVVGYPASLTISSMAQGDILFVDSTPKVNRLAAGTSGYFLATHGASANPVWSNNFSGGNLGIGTTTPGQLLDVQGTVRALNFIGIPTVNWVPNNIQTFTSSGTWTKPAGVSQVYVKVIGAGGNGGAVNNQVASAGGGGGGGYAEGIISVSGNVTVTIGSTNSFAGSVTISATSGSNGGGGGSANGGAGGAGGTGSNGTINLTGSTGQGGGFNSAGGNGGGTCMGAGGGGGTGSSGSGGGTAGSNGGSYGGGGGGDGRISSGTGSTGDAGAVIVYY